MSKRHDAIFDDVLKDLSAQPAADKAGARFLKRTNALADSGEREEKVLRWVDPASCVMWARHNRAYDLLTEDNCRDLIDSLKAQGQQEFPAIVRKLPPGQGPEYEVICGARRHFAVSWLRANNYSQFRYLIEVRDLTDEEAFRLADIENRDRADLSDYERACDYLQALDIYYGGKQKTMAARLEVSEAWLSRYLHLARLPKAILDAFPQLTEIRELHARSIRPLLQDAEGKVLAEAAAIAQEQAQARAGQGSPVPVPKVLARLKAAAYGSKPAAEKQLLAGALTIEHRGRKVRLEFPDSISEADLRAGFESYLAGHFQK
ncbi:chromosome partitioning protein, ParB family [Paracoccus aminovorans]|uniref:Chromosome partitioning protein, ParB family n=1 Tax=Paracoccus aminovorans TaxID=34004 RepID=A0A1I3CY60_9RHOB|nr:ParB/RepB/Spo0J family partition protein [Paracoccus aminovorans]CQR83791.1 parB-like partition proteins [Paracoccus aminovorans]SFH79189.1 chromosome partitioning protein, ParB family [Paracoccus aminovorans]